MAIEDLKDETELQETVNANSTDEKALKDYWTKYLKDIQLEPFHDIYQRQRIDFQDFANNFTSYDKLTTEWIIINFDQETQTFFKDHEVILINMQY